MEKILNVAQYLHDQYYAETDEYLDELKLQKLLYFAQRESIAITGEPLFQEELQGWVHGPVSPLVRKYFEQGKGISCETKPLSIEAAAILNNVLAEYGGIASWKLRNMSHEEISWKNSRKGMSKNCIGQRALKLSDIEEDAKKVRPFDHTWGMYYDEFDDYDGELDNA